jgi:hypothetical protein
MVPGTSSPTPTDRDFENLYDTSENTLGDGSVEIVALNRDIANGRLASQSDPLEIDAITRTDGTVQIRSRFQDGSSSESELTSNGDLSAQGIITRNAAGQITSRVTATDDGGAILTNYENGNAVSQSFSDSNGHLLRTEDYAEDGSATVSLYDASGNVSTIQNVNAAGTITSQQWLDQNGGVIASQNNDQNGNGQTFNAGGQSFSMAGLAGALGSTIGGFLGGNSLVDRVAAGTAISTIAGRFGALVDQSINTSGAALNNSGSSLFDTAFQKSVAGDGTVTSLGWGGDAIAGGLSSLLVGEAAQALGLHGLEATAFNTVAGSVTTQLMRNAYGIISAGGDLTGANAGSLFGGFDTPAHARTYPRRRASTRMRGMQPRAVAGKTQPKIPPTKCKTRDICP